MRAGLFGRELVEQGVVLDALFEFIVLQRKLGILVFHLSAIHVGQLAQFFEFLFLLLLFLAPARGENRQAEEHQGGIITFVHESAEVEGDYSMMVIQPCLSSNMPYWMSRKVL